MQQKNSFFFRTNKHSTMQDCRRKQRTSSSDSRARSPSAASAAMSSLATPRDETETEEDPFADAGSGSESDERKSEEKGEHFKVNVHALSSDDDAVTGEETENEEAESNMDTDQAHGDEEIPPRLTSTPVSESAAIFKIVDIENRVNGIFPIPGDDNSAHSAMQSGDAVSAKTSDENSARAMS
jgi:hypothetical protein